MSQELLLEIKNLAIQFPQQEEALFSNVNIQIYNKTIFGIFGETGCGKTTLAKSLVGFLPKEYIQGEIWFYAEETISLHNRNAKFFQQHILGKKIVYVPQDPYQTLNPFETLRTQLQRVIDLNEPQPMNQLLECVEFPLDKVDIAISSLSAGQRQRATIALALACSPHLLIFDEPTASLDRETRKKLLQFLQNLPAQKNLSIVIISHEIFDYESLIPRENRYYFQQYADNQDAVKRDVTTGQKILEAHNIQKNFGKHEILKDIDFYIENGTWVHLQGKNGSGKTTFMNILSGLQKINSGKIYWEENDISQQVIAYQKYIHLVYQDSFHSFNYNHTVKKILQEVINCDVRFCDELQNFCDKWYPLLEIPTRIYECNPKQISYGQQKRVALLRTLLKFKLYGLRDPQHSHLFLLDEIFAGIHIPLRYKIMTLFVSLFAEQENFAVLWIAHGQDLLRDFCDRDYLLSQGSMKEVQQ
ncbi:ATP-binding cassette domain-containing protein [Candidatus Uabimicrobium amorphum]|uniref:ABC transporter ATP-binding protein n=1 Tax=Uabimicrobium amorphum TaxID=2596890 RepID=A0A5S9II96_UABAM|nr:ATP-binding cassette domain-containing protein [Candidatus Uabimicrobium amorphum]BBM81976.1 ABC transporter ATP-binding protein [Candidatus Uabimicrobium amorphum]